MRMISFEKDIEQITVMTKLNDGKMQAKNSMVDIIQMFILGYLFGYQHTHHFFHTSLQLMNDSGFWTWATGVKKFNGWQPYYHSYCASIQSDPQGTYALFNAGYYYCRANSTYPKVYVLCESKENYV